MTDLCRLFDNDERGAAAIEYCLIAAGIGLAIFGAVTLVGPTLHHIFTNVVTPGR
jgi:Flp pilus assembly pilin Flp